MSNNLWYSLFSTNYTMYEKWQLIKSYFIFFSDLDVPQLYNSSLLHLAAKSNDTNLLEKVTDNEDMDINLQDVNGWTALHIAAYYGNLDMVRYLVDKCLANPNIKTSADDRNATAIYIATSNLDIDLTMYFISKGCEFKYQSLTSYGDKNTENYLKELYIQYINNEVVSAEIAEAIRSYNLEIENNCQKEQLFHIGHIFKKISVSGSDNVDLEFLIGNEMKHIEREREREEKPAQRV